MIVDVLQRTPDDGGEAPASRARLRRIGLDQDGSTVVLNQVSDPQSWDGPLFAGQLVHLKPGTDLPVVPNGLDDDVATYSIETLTLGENRQFVNGILYFAVVGNHIGLIEDNKARGRTLERYLTAFFERAGEFQEGQFVQLNAKLQGELKHVEKLELTPAPGRRDEPAESLPAATSTQTITDASSAGADVFRLLEVLGWTAQDIESLQASLPEEGYIEGRLNVFFKRKGRRKATIQRQALEEAIRNLGPQSVALLGAGKERGGFRTLSENVSVATVNGLLKPEAAMQAIVESLRAWAASGDIDCSFDSSSP